MPSRWYLEVLPGSLFYSSMNSLACMLSHFSWVWLCSTPWTVACQAPLCPWDSLGGNAGEGYHALLQRVFPTQRSNPHLLRLTCVDSTSFTASATGKPIWSRMDPNFKGLLSKYFQKFILGNKNICKYTYIFASSCPYVPSSIHFSPLCPLIPSTYHFLNILGNIQFLVSVYWKQQWISDAELYGYPQEELIVKHRVMRNLIDKVLVKEDFFFFSPRMCPSREKIHFHVLRKDSEFQLRLISKMGKRLKKNPQNLKFYKWE